jgi:hypothetical protein
MQQTFSTGQLSAFIIQLVTWQVLTRKKMDDTVGYYCYIASRGGSKRGGAPGARPPKIGKKYDFWRKIVIFHTKYPNNFFKYAPPNLKSWIRPGFNISFYVNPYGILKIISAKNSIKLIVQKRLIV